MKEHCMVYGNPRNSGRASLLFLLYTLYSVHFTTTNYESYQTKPETTNYEAFQTLTATELRVEEDKKKATKKVTHECECVYREW